MARRDGFVRILLEVGAGVGLFLLSAVVLTRGGFDLFSAPAQAGSATPPYDLSVLKTDSPDPVIAGNQITYDITVAVTSNTITATSYVKLDDLVPPNTTFQSLTSPGDFSCTTPAVGQTGPISCQTQSVIVGQPDKFTLVVNVPASVSDGTIITNTATVMPLACLLDGCDVTAAGDCLVSNCDENPSNDSSTATTKVITQADLVFSKKAVPDRVFQGNLVTYTMTVTNNGPSDAQNVQIADTIPANSAFVLATPSDNGNCTTPAVGDAGPVTCTFPGATPPGAMHSVVLIVRVCEKLPCTEITNAASASSGTYDPDPDNNAESVTTTVQPVPAPVLSPAGLGGAVLLLFAVGCWALYRRQPARR